MSLARLLAIVLLAIAFICLQVPTAVIGVGSGGWLILGLIAYVVDSGVVIKRP